LALRQEFAGFSRSRASPVLLAAFNELDLSPGMTEEQFLELVRAFQHQALIAPLSASDAAAVHQMWDVPEHSERVAVSLPMGARGTSVAILDMHIWRMRGRGWLFDESINAYMWLLQQQDDALCALDRNRRPCRFFSTFFFEKVS
jgi:Ulp1 family protease